jgi:hypothetical protein
VEEAFHDIAAKFPRFPILPFKNQLYEHRRDPRILHLKTRRHRRFPFQRHGPGFQSGREDVCPDRTGRGPALCEPEMRSRAGHRAAGTIRGNQTGVPHEQDHYDLVLYYGLAWSHLTLLKIDNYQYFVH